MNLIKAERGQSRSFVAASQASIHLSIILFVFDEKWRLNRTLHFVIKPKNMGLKWKHLFLLSDYRESGNGVLPAWEFGQMGGYCSILIIFHFFCFSLNGNINQANVLSWLFKRSKKRSEMALKWESPGWFFKNVFMMELSAEPWKVDCSF